MTAPHLILFMRHGDADTPACTHPDHHCMGLSESGRLQARQAAQDLSGLPVDRLIASPLPRAVETASHLAQAVALPIETDDRLEERVLRPLYGKSYDQIAREYGNEISDALARGDSDAVSIPGVDDLPGYADRVRACRAEIGPAQARLTIIVGHGGPHEWFLGSLLSDSGLLPRRWFTLGKCRTSLFRFEAGARTPSRILGINLATQEARDLIEQEHAST